MVKHMVETVLGPIPADALGIVLPHEHVPLRLGPSPDDDLREPPPPLRARLEEIELDALRDVRQFGARTLVEATPFGCCRSISMMQRLSRATGMHIVACTGFYLEDRFPASIRHYSADEMADLCVRELTEEIEGTGVRPWLIKISGAPELGMLERRAFTAAACASLQTGAAITTHSSHATRAHFDRLVREGADPSRIYIGHADFGDDASEHLYVARAGGHLIFTFWGIQHWVDQDRLVRHVVELVDAGFASSVLLSIDYAAGYSPDGTKLLDEHFGCENRRHAFLFRYTLPRLRAAGISEAVIHQFLVDNPQAMLCRDSTLT